ncbi:MAG: acetyl-CoA carboxylase, biotin carboxyl carrier protein [Chloroflexi bacterium]|nr:acetyl-CoA carboxylase, biotin carboxyl carrier protein [Chloroflexota bacterium]
MSESLELLDDLRRLATRHGVRIEVEGRGVALSVTPLAGAVTAAAPPRAAEERAVDTTRRVTATAVGIFSAAKEWGSGERVTRGTVLGAIQSLGHMAEIVAPADGEISEVLVAGGAPVEYGQPLFAITLS